MGTRHFFRKASSVSAQEALELWSEGRALILDVRATNQRRTVIPGSMHIPLGELEGRALGLPEDTLLITFCIGGLISTGAANLLTELGFESASIIRGLIGWRAAGGHLDEISR